MCLHTLQNILRQAGAELCQAQANIKLWKSHETRASCTTGAKENNFWQAIASLK